MADLHTKAQTPVERPQTVGLDRVVPDVVRPEGGIWVGDEIAVEIIDYNGDLIVQSKTSFMHSRLCIKDNIQLTVCQEGGIMFSERIRILRDESGLTQAQVATQVGLSTRGYQDLELGATPRGDRLLAIAEFYGVSMDWLMGRTDVREVNRG